jgi:hypothetical protein
MSDVTVLGLVMDFGPILRRELIVASRRGAVGLRAGIAGLMLLVMALVVVGWYASGQDRSSLAGMAALARVVFGAVVGLQALLLLMMVPGEVTRILAGERQRKTLDGILASSLSSAGIVVGVFLAGLVRWASCLAAGLPVSLLMVPLLGVDPSLVLLAHAGLAWIPTEGDPTNKWACRGSMRPLKSSYLLDLSRYRYPRTIATPATTPTETADEYRCDHDRAVAPWIQGISRLS